MSPCLEVPQTLSCDIEKGIHDQEGCETEKPNSCVDIPVSSAHALPVRPRLRHFFIVVFKIVAVVLLLTVLTFTIWYFFGWMIALELIIVAIVAILAAGGGIKWLKIIYRTLPRDLTALQRYIRFLWSVRVLKTKDMNIGDIFAKHVEKRPNDICFIFEDTEWTFLEVEEFSNKVANVFKSQGLVNGDAVALMMDNRPEFVCFWLGLSKIGVVTALINTNLRQSSLSHSINVANCKCFIYSSVFSEAVQEVASSIGNVRRYNWSPSTRPVSTIQEGEETQLEDVLKSAPSTTPTPSSKVGFNDKLLYIYTSGTTGLPKAANITHCRLVFLAGAIHYQVGFDVKDRYYTPLPLYHTAGGTMAIGQALVYGSTVVIRNKFSASNYFADIVKYNCTVAQYIGEMCRYLLSTPPRPEDKDHKLRMIFGNGLRPQIWREFVERFNIPKVAEFYGATEGNANIANIDNTEGAIGFVSRLVPSVYPISIIKVNQETGEPLRNKDGLCMTCQPGEPGVFIGKIIPSNPARAFLGYVNETESKKKIVHDVFNKGDSAFISGDLLVMDEWGYLYFKDRTGDTFRWKGENVSTSEVEGLVSNISNYKDCVVYGVEIPRCEGRAGMAAILDPNCDLDLTSLAEGVKKALPVYARPVFVRLLQEVEMTGTYKLKKLDLQKEGFNPSTIEDKIYFLSASGKYELLTPELYKDIEVGVIRF
ncbi:long-chain fatty acid transport protein 4-like [Macrosteles quadrilineatus]|uniref:long-chain fatty acid transport protein 4-like n=1 Tax=Macrosteles quadrilineatus TaxID=74068 RepID=UPI0023E0AE9D|nr:long-chain fatty acid transport protein 4-like [Macrosteles quadrilineatus]